MKAMETATGSLSKAQQIYIDSVQGRLNQLSATFQTLSQTLLNSSILKGGIQALTALLSVLNSILGVGDGIIIKIALLSAAFAAGAGRVKLTALINMPAFTPAATRNESAA